LRGADNGLGSTRDGLKHAPFERRHRAGEAQDCFEHAPHERVVRDSVFGSLERLAHGREAVLAHRPLVLTDSLHEFGSAAVHLDELLAQQLSVAQRRIAADAL
jgi:hypothetical protein